MQVKNSEDKTVNGEILVRLVHYPETDGHFKTILNDEVRAEVVVSNGMSEVKAGDYVALTTQPDENKCITFRGERVYRTTNNNIIIIIPTDTYEKA